MSGRSKRANSARAEHPADGAEAAGAVATTGLAAEPGPGSAGFAVEAIPAAATGPAGDCCSTADGCAAGACAADCAFAGSLCTAKNCAAKMAAAAACVERANFICLLKDINVSSAFLRRQDVRH